MATITWRGGSGNWSSPPSWVGFVVPAAGDSVVIGGDAATVTLDVPETIAAIALDGGTLLLKSTLDLAGGLTIAGGTFDLSGTLRGGTLDGSVIGQGGTLAGVTVLGGIDKLAGTAGVGGGLTLDAVTVSRSSSGTVVPAGILLLAGGTYDNQDFVLGSGRGLATGYGSSVVLGPQTVDALGGARLDVWTGIGTIVNQGTIKSTATDAAFEYLSVGGDSFANQGAISFGAVTLVTEEFRLRSPGPPFYYRTESVTYERLQAHQVSIASASLDNSGSIALSGNELFVGALRSATKARSASPTPSGRRQRSSPEATTAKRWSFRQRCWPVRSILQRASEPSSTAGRSSRSAGRKAWRLPARSPASTTADCLRPAW